MLKLSLAACLGWCYLRLANKHMDSLVYTAFMRCYFSTYVTPSRDEGAVLAAAACAGSRGFMNGIAFQSMRFECRTADEREGGHIVVSANVSKDSCMRQNLTLLGCGIYVNQRALRVHPLLCPMPMGRGPCAKRERVIPVASGE